MIRLDFKKDLLKTAGIKSPVKDTLLALTEENEHIHPWKQHGGIRSCEKRRSGVRNVQQWLIAPRSRRQARFEVYNMKPNPSRGNYSAKSKCFCDDIRFGNVDFDAPIERTGRGDHAVETMT